ncbi:MAG: VPLPA-CTERM sorting domain-containing protein [Qingshengfaniella sp.]
MTINGTTAESEGTLSYSPGSTFTAVAVLDDTFVETASSADVGGFFNYLNLTSALQSFELTTELGTVRYEPTNLGVTHLPPQVNQINTPNQQTLSIYQQTISTAGGPDGWSGNMGSLLPNAFNLVMSATGIGNYLFHDPNSLLSGAGNLDTNPDLFAGAIIVSEFGLASVYDQTELFFGAGDFTISGGDGGIGQPDPVDPTPSVVPVPASLPLLLAGFGALGLIRRRTA